MTEDAQDDIVSQRFKSVVDLLASASTLMGGILYFGWVRTSAVFDYFGADESLLNFSVQDYLLRSVNVLFRPAFYLLTVATLGLLFLVFIDRMDESSREAFRRWFFASTAVVGITLLLATFLGLNDAFPPFLSALALGFGFFVLFCSSRVGATIYLTDTDRRAHNLNRAATILTAIAISMSLFWTTSIYAQQNGLALASSIARNPEVFARVAPPVVLYSRFPLHVDEWTGVVASRLAGPSDAMNYRYTGYRLLIYSNNRWFLIPATRSDSRPSAMLTLVDDGSVRVAICYDECGSL